MISTLVALPYELTRLPLVIADDGLLSGLPLTSTPRVALDRVIGSADKLAGTVLRNQDIAERGADRIERSERLLTASRLEREAGARREQAHDVAAAGRQEAADKRRAAQDRAASGLDEADTVEARGKEQAGKAAARSAAAKQEAADERAASRTTAAERRKKGAESAATARKRAAQREAGKELDDARDKKRSADEARADAERLSDLTTAKKRQRTQR